jgi:hypothetical protein
VTCLDAHVLFGLHDGHRALPRQQRDERALVLRIRADGRAGRTLARVFDDFFAIRDLPRSGNLPSFWRGRL